MNLSGDAARKCGISGRIHKIKKQQGCFLYND